MLECVIERAQEAHGTQFLRFLNDLILFSLERQDKRRQEKIFQKCDQKCDQTKSQFKKHILLEKLSTKPQYNIYNSYYEYQSYGNHESRSYYR